MLRTILTLVAITAGTANADERVTASKYQLEWRGAFHSAIEIRVDLIEGQPGRVVALVMSEPPLEKKRILSPAQSALFIQELQAAGFWSLPEKAEPACPRGAVCTGCRDGARWTISAEEPSRRHVVWRHCNMTDSVKPIGSIFLRFGELNVDHELY